MEEPTARMQVRIPVSRWRALLLLAEAEHRTPGQQLVHLVERWWSQDPDLKPWLEEAYQRWPEMREPEWWQPRKTTD